MGSSTLLANQLSLVEQAQKSRANYLFIGLAYREY